MERLVTRLILFKIRKPAASNRYSLTVYFEAFKNGSFYLEQSAPRTTGKVPSPPDAE